MSEVFDVTISELDPKDENSTFEIGNLFVTRAAVKFSFSIHSEDSGTNLFLKDIIVNKIADKEYLIPRETTYVPLKLAYPSPNWQYAPDPNLTGRFITEYSTPNPSHSYVTFSPPQPVELKEYAGTDENGKDKIWEWAPPVYFCESSFINLYDNDNPYSVQITLAEKDQSDKFAYFYICDAKPLTNLPILPRNTHVHIDITVGTNGVFDCVAAIVPYIGRDLKPEFGIDRAS